MVAVGILEELGKRRFTRKEVDPVAVEDAVSALPDHVASVVDEFHDIESRKHRSVPVGIGQESSLSRSVHEQIRATSVNRSILGVPLLPLFARDERDGTITVQSDGRMGAGRLGKRRPRWARWARGRRSSRGCGRCRSRRSGRYGLSTSRREVRGSGTRSRWCGRGRRGRRRRTDGCRSRSRRDNLRSRRIEGRRSRRAWDAWRRGIRFALPARVDQLLGIRSGRPHDIRVGLAGHRGSPAAGRRPGRRSTVGSGNSQPRSPSGLRSEPVLNDLTRGSCRLRGGDLRSAAWRLGWSELAVAHHLRRGFRSLPIRFGVAPLNRTATSDVNGNVAERREEMSRVGSRDAAVNFLSRRRQNDVGGPSTNAVFLLEFRMAADMDFDRNVMERKDARHLGVPEDVVLHFRTRDAVVVPEVEQHEALTLSGLLQRHLEFRLPGNRPLCCRNRSAQAEPARQNDCPHVPPHDRYSSKD